MPPRDYYKATRSPRQSGGTPKSGTGASGPPGRNYPVSKPTPFVDKRVTKSVSTSDVATGKFTGGTQRATPKPEPDKTFIKKVTPPIDTSGDTGREAGIKKYATTGLKELGKKRKEKVIGILEDPNISSTQKRNVITKQNLGGAYQSLINPILAKNPETQKITQDRIKNKRINAYGSQNFNKLDPRRHFAFNQEMSNAIREYAYSMGVTDAWRGNQFIDNLYNFTGAAHSASMYPGTQIPQSIYSAAYQGFDAVVEAARGAIKPLEALSSGASDFFQNIKGIWSEPKSEDQLLNDAFNKINKYVASGKHRTESSLMNRPVDMFGQPVAKKDTGEFQVAEFKTNKYTDMIGKLLPSYLEKGLKSETSIHGENVPYSILGKEGYKNELEKNEATDEFGWGGYEGDVSDSISDFSKDNIPESPQEWHDMKEMFKRLPNNVRENLKNKKPDNYHIDDWNSVIT